MDNTATTPDFRELYRTHFDFVWRNLRALGVAHADLEDAAQETFVVAYRRRDAFDPSASMRGWLYGIARRIAFRQRRGGGRRTRLHDAVGREPSRSPTLDDGMQTRDGWRLLTTFVDGLPQTQRDAFLLLELEGMTAAEAGRALGVSSNTASSRLRAARASFDRYVQTLRARERGVERKLSREALQRSAKPTAAQRKRVAAVLAADLGRRTPWLALPLLKPLAAVASVGVLATVVISGDPPPDDPVRSGHIAQTEPQPSTKPAANTRAEVAHVAPSHVDAPVPVLLSPANAPVTPSQPATPARTAHAPDHEVPPARHTSDDLAAEAALVRRIRSSSDDAAALRLAQRYEREHPAGTLSVEVHTLRAKALCRLGRESEARRWARVAAQAVPDGPAAKLSRHGCAAIENKPNEVTPQRPSGTSAQG